MLHYVGVGDRACGLAVTSRYRTAQREMGCPHRAHASGCLHGQVAPSDDGSWPLAIRPDALGHAGEFPRVRDACAADAIDHLVTDERAGALHESRFSARRVSVWVSRSNIDVPPLELRTIVSDVGATPRRSWSALNYGRKPLDQARISRSVIKSFLTVNAYQSVVGSLGNGPVTCAATRVRPGIGRTLSGSTVQPPLALPSAFQFLIAAVP